jgi:hypothetical protein
METKSYPANRFSGGFITGALGALFLGIVLLYVLNMSEVLAISVLDVPSVQRALSWAYENLRLSVVPFFLTLIFYTGALWRLKHYLRDQGASVEKIAQADHLVDIWINLFFGIGVIWTAIGMRGALLEGLGNLNAHSAAKLGAFSILQRLVDGGILLALSTTIVGAVGGYLLRLIKSLAVGTQVRIYYNRMAKEQADAVNVVLNSIDEQLNQLVSCAERQTPEQRTAE